ncbi:MAG: Uma2 family endonuclease [Phycisphaerales bacterium]|nr:Uma2 family endonuclease [Phycisphaerales bacterium]
MGHPAVDPRRYTVAEYFQIDRDAVEKHEYRDGQIVAMAGGTPAHSLIIANVTGEVRARLKGTSCRSYDSNLRVKIPRDARYVYPDASVVCGPVEYDPADKTRQTATNPRVVVEVLSPSTEAYDRGDKFRRYLRIPTLQEYVLVSQVVPVVETYARQVDGSWVFRAYEGLDAVARLSSVDVELPLAEVFAGVEFPAAEPEPVPNLAGGTGGSPAT